MVMAGNFVYITKLREMKRKKKKNTALNWTLCNFRMCAVHTRNTSINNLIMAYYVALSCG
jgi:hypothetical protein